MEPEDIEQGLEYLKDIMRSADDLAVYGEKIAVALARVVSIDESLGRIADALELIVKAQVK